MSIDSEIAKYHLLRKELKNFERNPVTEDDWGMLAIALDALSEQAKIISKEKKRLKEIDDKIPYGITP